MLRYIGLALVAIALVAVTAETVHARGGGRAGHWRSYNFGNSGFLPGYYRNSGTNLSSHHRGTSGTGISQSTSQNSSVATNPTTTTKHSTISATNASSTSTQQTTTPSTNAATGTLQSQQQPVVTNGPLVTPYIGIPLDPNAAAQRTYGPLLHNAKQLIKAGIYGPAANYLQRIINGAPGTRIAAEAQRLLARLPTV